MRRSSYLYNNEAIASISIGYFMKLHKKIEFAKILFILPFVLHEQSMRKLKNRSYKRSLEEFIVKNPECIINFNTRFFDFLPLAINALTILNEMGIITIQKDTIYYNENSNFFPSYYSQIGERATNIFSAIDELNSIVKNEDTNSFYIKMKVEL